MTAKPIPDGFHTVTPYLLVKEATQLLEFLKNAFDAETAVYHSASDGKIMHAQAKIGDSIIMLGEACGDHKPVPAMLYLYVKDVDAVYKKAVQAGGKTLREPADQFYGDRVGSVEDASGNQWWIATHKEDVSKEDLKARA